MTQTPYFDATGNGAVMTGRLYVTPSGRMFFAESYLVDKLRQRFSAEAGEQLDLNKDGKRVRMTMEVIGEGDV